MRNTHKRCLRGKWGPHAEKTSLFISLYAKKACEKLIKILPENKPY